MWDSSFAGWRPGPGDVLLRAYSDAVNTRLLDRWLPARSGHILKTDLFDEAVGEGLVEFLLGRAERVSGIDVAPSVVDAAACGHRRLEALTADVRDLPYPDATFDTVVSTSTLDHFDEVVDILQALRELRRVLRPGGSLIITLDNASNPLVALRNVIPYDALRRLGLVPYPTGTTFGLDELSRHAVASGLDVDDATAIMHVPRLAVRPLGRVVVGRPNREQQLLSTLLRAEPPRSLPLRAITGQFVGVRATRPVESRAGRQLVPATRALPSALAGRPRDIAMRVLGRTVDRRLVWMEMELRRDRPLLEADVPLDVSFLAMDDSAEIAAFRPGLAAAGVRARFARGDRCFCARHDGRIVELSWVATGVAPIEYLQAGRALRQGAVYHYERYTDPAMLGRGIAPATGSRLCRALADEGFDTFTTAVHSENWIAMRHALRFGLRPVGTVGWVGAGRFRRYFRGSL